jgi:hypothetical protein
MGPRLRGDKVKLLGEGLPLNIIQRFVRSLTRPNLPVRPA